VTKEKLAVRNDQLKPLRIPKIPELSIGRMWPIATRNELFYTYMPDSWTGPVKTDRTFFF